MVNKGMLPQAGAARVLAASTIVNTIGIGFFMTVSAIYFTRSVGLSRRAVGPAQPSPFMGASGA